jgi:hypothetical protein
MLKDTLDVRSTRTYRPTIFLERSIPSGLDTLSSAAQAMEGLANSPRTQKRNRQCIENAIHLMHQQLEHMRIAVD